MKLNSLNWEAAVAQGHDLSVVRNRAHVKIARDGVRLDRERMVPAADKRVWDSFEDRLAVVLHQARFAVENPTRVSDPAAEGRDDSLMPQTHT